LAFYLVKNKIKEKYNFLNKFTIKRTLKKQKYLPIFNFFKNASTSTRELFLSFNQETF
jgi:uncharacterized iron-regulated protein